MRTLNPTCAAAGNDAYKCTVCGAVTANREVAKKSHTEGYELIKTYYGETCHLPDNPTYLTTIASGNCQLKSSILRDRYKTYRNSIFSQYGMTSAAAFKDVSSVIEGGAKASYNTGHGEIKIGSAYYPASKNKSGCLYKLEADTYKSDRSYHISEWCTVYRGVNNKATDWTDNRWYGSITINVYRRKCSVCHNNY